ncbi:MAG TPA: FMN-binding glutamate synthase family protein [Bauldia sp.]|nr:FMN-binding glutamate synthase family protein [Bauldia sp.]
MPHLWRYVPLASAFGLTLICIAAGIEGAPFFYWPLLLLLPLSALGIFDVVQGSHAILRNYPIIGHLRYLLEELRPSLRQYIIEDDRDPVPFSREQRNVAYRRAKDVHSSHPFGTIIDVNEAGHGWICHSIRAREIEDCDFRVVIGGPACRQPYSASLVNISGMSFGAISSRAILALNTGARMGNFAQNTGEGSISPYHRQPGGDLIWQVATGYFGCRDAAGNFDPEKFARTAALPSVKMIELKLSQGAKPGHGGVLPKAKITPEIAATRGITAERDCVSPPAHRAFATPAEMMVFVHRLRELGGGKPVGIKLCVGHRYEFLAMVKAMIATGVTPDYIVVDGTEGGTGAAPPELSNHVGLPLIDGLTFVHNALVGAGLRDRIRVGASGKLVTGYDLCRVYALGADFAMIARGFMFAVGCIQARSCHTNRCPTGIATQDALRQRAIVVPVKAERVANFHRNTLRAIADVLGAAGLSHPRELTPRHLQFRREDGRVIHGDEIHRPVLPGALVEGSETGPLAVEWARAQPNTFAPSA